MKNALDFLNDLQHNNNRDWFEANKYRYKAAKEEFDLFVEKFIAGVESFDSEVKGLEVKSCTYRIYRDVRFGHNKDPYKNHFGAYVCRGGKNSGFSGYYFHLQPPGEGVFSNGSFISVGSYMPQPGELKSIRQEIMDNSDGFLAAIKKAKGFVLGQENKLKRPPVGFPADSPMIEYLKLKDVYLSMAVGPEFMTSPDVLTKTLAAYKTAVDFNHILNRAIEYAREME